MKNLKNSAVIAVVAALVGCAHERKNQADLAFINPKGYVKGTTTRPESAIKAISDATVNEMNAETYREAVKQGLAPALPGGAGADFNLHYRGLILPPELGGVPNNPDSRKLEEKVLEVKEMAQDSIKTHRKTEACLKDWEACQKNLKQQKK